MAPTDSSHPLTIQLISTYYAPETTGNAPYSASLAEGLAARGHRVSVVAAAPHYPGWRILPVDQWQTAETHNGVDVERVTSYVPAQPSFLKRLVYEALFGLKFAARADLSADVILMVSPSLFASAVVRARLSLSRQRPKTILWMQDLYSAGVRESTRGGMAGRAVTGLERLIARSFDRIVVIHDRFATYVTGTLDVPADRVVVVRNWTHVRPDAAADPQALRREVGWDRPGEVIVAHAGNMGAKQGLDTVVDAARLADERQAPIRFVLIGDGNQRTRLQERARGINRIQFLDPLPDGRFLRTLSAADVLLVNERPGLNEAAVPSKLTTYFVTGRPVLAATEPTSTTADEMCSSGAGRIVCSGDPAALLEAALDLPRQWSDDDRLAGPRYVDAVLSEEAAVSSFSHLLTSLTAPEAQKACV